jgi:hypothetical protein
MGEDQAMAARGLTAVLGRMTAVRDGSGGFERGEKELLINVEFQRIHGAIRIGDHAISGHDSVALDKIGARREYQTITKNYCCTQLTARGISNSEIPALGDQDSLLVRCWP